MVDPVIEEEVIEEIEDETEEVEEVIVDKRLLKSVNRLKKDLNIKDVVLKGLTLEQQFDRLEFMADNMPERKVRKAKNKPIIANPIDTDAMKYGRAIANASGNDFYLFKTEEWINQTKNLIKK